MADRFREALSQTYRAFFVFLQMKHWVEILCQNFKKGDSKGLFQPIAGMTRLGRDFSYGSAIG